MAGKQFVAELTEGMAVDSDFVLRSREMRAARTGDAYLTLELADRTGRIGAVLFRPGREAGAVPAGTVVRARGRATLWKGTKRLALDELRAATGWDRSDMLPSAVRPRRELVAELRERVSEIEEAGLGRLVRSVFGDKTFFAAFCECPGSQSYHHAYIGGLLEHTVRVAGLARQLAEGYPGVDRDLLVTAALLHDIGKVDEISFDTSIAYTDRGRLLGHVMLGVERLGAHARQVDLDGEALVRLEHAIVSHHGELEWGSPKRPSTIEALLLHHIDNLDAKAAGFSEALNGATVLEEPWTDAYNLFRRPLYAPRPAEDDRDHVPAEDGPYHRRTA